jgi:UDPglucose 6-dehydrogenase
MDGRIGKHGTIGGRPFGGSCFPKDTEAFAGFARKMNLESDLIETAININKQIENLNSEKIYVKEQLTKDHNTQEP